MNYCSHLIISNQCETKGVPFLSQAKCDNPWERKVDFSCEHSSNLIESSFSKRVVLYPF